MTQKPCNDNPLAGFLLLGISNLKVKIFQSYYYEPIGFLDPNQKPINGKVKVKWQDETETYHDAKKVVIVKEVAIDMPETEVSVVKEENINV